MVNKFRGGMIFKYFRGLKDQKFEVEFDFSSGIDKEVKELIWLKFYQHLVVYVQLFCFFSLYLESIQILSQWLFFQNWEPGNILFLSQDIKVLHQQGFVRESLMSFWIVSVQKLEYLMNAPQPQQILTFLWLTFILVVLSFTFQLIYLDHR